LGKLQARAEVRKIGKENAREGAVRREASMTVAECLVRGKHAATTSDEAERSGGTLLFFFRFGYEEGCIGP